MHCSRVAVRLACSQTLLVRANPARPVSLVPSSSVTVRFASATSDREGKYLKKKKISEKRKGKDGEDIEEAPENALSVKDETDPATVFPQLRHQHKSPIPGFNDKNSITDNEQQQREVIRRQEQLRAQKQDILRKVKALDSVKLDAQTLRGQMMDVTFNSIEEAYAAFRGQLEIALYEKNPEKAYETIVNSRRMGLRFPKKDYDAAAILFAEEQHIYKVKDVWEYMQKDEIYPDQESFMNVFTIYCHMTQYEWALRTFFKMCEYICPDANAYEQGIELFAKNTHIGNLRKAEQLFHTVQRFDVKHNAETCGNFIKMLCASGYEGDADRAIDVLKYMKTKVIEPIPAEVPKYFVDHIKKFVIPERAYIRAKKVLRGCQHAGLPEEPFKALWTVVDSKAYVNKIERADLAAPLEKMDLTPKKQTPGLRYG